MHTLKNAYRAPFLQAFLYTIQFSTKTVPLGYYRMYRTLTNPKLLRRLAHSCPLFDDIISNLDCPLFDIIFHKKSLHSLFFTIYAGILLVIQLLELYCTSTVFTTSIGIWNCSNDNVAFIGNAYFDYIYTEKFCVYLIRQLRSFNILYERYTSFDSFTNACYINRYEGKAHFI